MRLPRGVRRGTATASLAMTVALGAALYTGIRAATDGPLPMAPEPPTAETDAPATDTAAPEDAATRPPPADSAATARFDRWVLAAVSRDPFRPDRRRPPGRYRPPGSDERRAGADDDGPAPLPEVRLVGLAVGSPGPGLAALSGPDGARLVRPGEEFAGFRLVAVESGTARLVSRDTVLVLALDSPVGRIREEP